VILPLPKIRTSLFIVLIIFAISTSSVIGSGYAKRMASGIFSESETVQTSDVNENIMGRIANLQKQINELERQIVTRPPGPPEPPGPPGSLKDLVSEVITVTADTHDPNPEWTEGTTHCPEGTVITGGGYGAPLNTAQVYIYNGPGPGQSWSVKAFDQPMNGFSVFAVCAHLE